MNQPKFQLEFAFPRNYQVRLLQAAPPIHPVEKLYHYPVELEEGDRAGAYVRVEPQGQTPWTAFFALGFDSEMAINAIYSCPDPDFFCAIAGGYAYVVKACDPANWFRIEQRPATVVRAIPELRLILFAGFTSITALGASGIEWTTERLSWEGVSIAQVEGNELKGLGWDAITNKEVPFAVDLRTGRHSGGARPQASSSSPAL
jgi:hypothetical protein